MGSVVAFNLNLETFGPCCDCGIQWAAPQAYVQKRRADGAFFYCPNGHKQHYTETEVMRLEKALAREKQLREWAEQNERAAREGVATARKAEAIARGKLRAQSERVKNGVCPCCKRHFTNLERHMHTKHPEFGNAENK